MKSLERKQPNPRLIVGAAVLTGLTTIVGGNYLLSDRSGASESAAKPSQPETGSICSASPNQREWLFNQEVVVLDCAPGITLQEYRDKVPIKVKNLSAYCLTFYLNSTEPPVEGQRYNSLGIICLPIAPSTATV